MQVTALNRTFAFHHKGVRYELAPGITQTHVPNEIADLADFKFAKENGELKVSPSPIHTEATDVKTVAKPTEKAKSKE